MCAQPCSCCLTCSPLLVISPCSSLPRRQTCLQHATSPQQHVGCTGQKQSRGVARIWAPSCPSVYCLDPAVEYLGRAVQGTSSLVLQRQTNWLDHPCYSFPGMPCSACLATGKLCWPKQQCLAIIMLMVVGLSFITLGVPLLYGLKVQRPLPRYRRLHQDTLCTPGCNAWLLAHSPRRQRNLQTKTLLTHNGCNP